MSEDKELTGWDSAGMEVYGPRSLGVGDDASGGDDQPINQTTRLPARPDGPAIQLVGGPLDGATVHAMKTPAHDLELLTIVDQQGNPSDEMYLARLLEGQWVGVYAEMLQDLVRSDEVHIKDPDPMELRMRLQEAFGEGAKIVLPICEPGKHQWTEWRPTAQGNRTRMCVICQTSQGAIF